MKGGRIYVVNFDISAVAAIKTLAQIKAGAATPLWLKLVRMDGDAVAAAALHWAILRKTAAATVTSFTPIPLHESAGTEQIAAAVGDTEGTGVNASAEDTDGAVLRQGTCSAQSGGGLYEPFEDGEALVGAGLIVALKIVVAPASVRLRGSLEFEEIG